MQAIADRPAILACALAALAALAPPAMAGEVTLRVKGGGLEVTGELRSFDGTAYVIDAPSVGTMTFDASRFECIGENCTRRVSLPGTAAEKPSADQPDRFTVLGSSQTGRLLMPALIRGYASSLGASVVPILGTGVGELKYRIADGGGSELATIVIQGAEANPVLASIDEGRAAIGIADSGPGAMDFRQAPKAAQDLRSAQSLHAVGQDGLAVVVSPENSLSSISEDLLARILAGQMATWGEAGASGGRITVYTAGARSSAGEILERVVLKPRGLAASAAAKELGSEIEVSDAVARDPGGIGIVSFAAERSAKRLNLEGACGLITRPTSFSVKAGEYPLSRPLYMYTAGTPSAVAARGLLRYALSRDAQPAIAEQDFIDDRIEQLAFEHQTERMAYALNVPAQSFDMAEMRKLLAELKGARRLSLTFRFSSGAFDLAHGSRLDVLKLAEFMQAVESAGKTALLIGFTDGEGRFSANSQISARRANQVRSAVLEAAAGRISPTAIVAKGYGSLAPIACNDTLERRQLNRRVEVWIKDK